MFYFWKNPKQKTVINDIPQMYQPITLEYWLALDEKTPSLFFNIQVDVDNFYKGEASGLTKEELEQINRALQMYFVQKLNIFEQRKEHRLPKMTLQQSIRLYSAIRKLVSSKV